MTEAQDVLCLGRGTNHAIALEAALKLKEICYIHAEGYAAGEMKHGPIALIDRQVPILAILPSGPLFEKTASNVQEAGARGGQIVVLSDAAGCAKMKGLAAETLELPTVDPFVAPDPVCDRGADAGLPHRAAARDRRGPAPQSGEERHGGVGLRWNGRRGSGPTAGSPGRRWSRAAGQDLDVQPWLGAAVRLRRRYDVRRTARLSTVPAAGHAEEVDGARRRWVIGARNGVRTRDQPSDA